MTEQNLLYTDIEDELRASLRAFLAPRTDFAALNAMYDGDRSQVRTLWRAASQNVGLAGLLVAEDRGGQGASAREAAVVMEELGRTLAPACFLTSAVLATTVVQGLDGELTRGMATGEHTGALAVPWSTSWDRVTPTVTPQADGRLSGTVRSVAGALEADLLVVPCDIGASSALYLVDAAHVHVTPVSSLDMTRQLADIRLDRVEARLLTSDGDRPLRTALTTAAGLLASEQLGIARWCLETTVDYLKERRQFGRVVGSFQAVKHRLADLYTRVESSAAAARYAAATLATGDADTELAVSVAQAYCSEVAVHAAEEATQLHGGIGMTWEHPMHLFLKRAKADQIALGAPDSHRERIGVLVDLPN